MPETNADPCNQPLGVRPPDCPVSFDTVLDREVDQITKAREARRVQGVQTENVEDSLIGLAFSGGGIRRTVPT